MSEGGVAGEKVGLSIDETAAVMGVGRSTVYSLISEGRLPARKIGRRTIIIRGDALAALRAAPTVPVKAA